MTDTKKLSIIDTFIYMYIFKKLRKDEKSCLIIR